MPKPLHSNDPNPKDNSFSTFGLLPDQKANRGAFATSTTIMVVAALLVVLASFVTPALNPPTRADFMVLAPPPPPPPPPPPVKPPPPPPPPKIVPPPPPKPEPAPTRVEPPAPKPPPPPPPPRAHQPPPPPPIALVANRRAPATTPLPVTIAINPAGHRNTVVNQPVGPDTLSVSTRKAPPSNAPIDMKATNVVNRKTPGTAAGNGPDIGALVTSSKTRASTFGNGPPTSALVVNKKGAPGGTGIGTDPSVPVNAKRTVAADRPPAANTGNLASAAKVLSEPNANDFITEDAKKNHIAGLIRVRIHVLASGVGQVLGLSGPGLGHGLDEASLNVARQIRWRPALDSSGHPIDSDITVGVRFQSAGVE
jgi:protein TonB